MKKLLILITVLTSFNVINAQNTNPKSTNQEKPSMVIKTSPLSLLVGGAKFGIDYAPSEIYTHDFQIGFGTDSYTALARIYGLYRYKRDIIKDTRRLNGIYFAPGIIVANETPSSMNNASVYSTLFTDVGVQISRRFSVDTFMGLGYTFSQNDIFSDPAAGCVGCGATGLATTLNAGPVALRLGVHIGINVE